MQVSIRHCEVTPEQIAEALEATRRDRFNRCIPFAYVRVGNRVSAVVLEIADLDRPIPPDQP